MTKKKVKAVETPTPYDDAFRTVATKCPMLFVALINKIFGKNYPPTAKVTPLVNEYYIHTQDGYEMKKITDSASEVTCNNVTDRYDVECELNLSSAVFSKLFNYGTQIGLTHGSTVNGNTMTVELPNSAILTLKSASKKKGDYYHRITSGQEVLVHPIRIIRVKDYSLDQIFDENILFLLPFYIFHYDGKLNDRMYQKLLLEDMEKIVKKLLEVQEEGKADPAEIYTLLEMCRKTARSYLKKYPELWKGVKKIMGGNVLSTMAERAVKKGRQEGILIGHAAGREEGGELMGKLTEILYSNGLVDEMLRAAKDSEYRQEMYRKYGLA